MSEQPTPPKRYPRREFVKVAGTASVAASAWWAITEKTDALAQPAPLNMKVIPDPTDNYEYEVP